LPDATEIIIAIVTIHHCCNPNEPIRMVGPWCRR
jgi:hypothetical protein